MLSQDNADAVTEFIEEIVDLGEGVYFTKGDVIFIAAIAFILGMIFHALISKVFGSNSLGFSASVRGVVARLRGVLGSPQMFLNSLGM